MTCRDSIKPGDGSADEPIPVNVDSIKGPVIVWWPCGDPCLMCSGEACNLCGVSGLVMLKATGCEHDRMQRHQEPATGGPVEGHPAAFGCRHEWAEGESGALTCQLCGLMTETPLRELRVREHDGQVVNTAAVGFTMAEAAEGARYAAAAGFTTRQAAEAIHRALRTRRP